MRQVNFTVLHETLLAIRAWQGFRVLYISNPALPHPPTLFSYGDNGIITIRDRLSSFYDGYLRGIPLFDDIFRELRADFDCFEREDLIQQRLETGKYKATILSICDRVDQLEKDLRRYFELAPIFQIYNSTFQTNTLFQYVHLCHRPEVWAFVPEDARRDLAEGARCILFDLPTAGVFILLRGLEGCIRKLFEVTVSSPAPRHCPMGPLLEKLRKYYQEESNAEAAQQLVLLEYIKDEYRNPSAHPGVHFDKGQAEKLFQLANIAIERVCLMWSGAVNGPAPEFDQEPSSDQPGQPAVLPPA